MEINNSNITGSINGVRRRISALTRANASQGFKIGITNDPQARGRFHASRYDEMIVLARTSCPDTVRAWEATLVDDYFDDDCCENETGGGGGSVGDQGSHYLYLVRRWPRAANFGDFLAIAAPLALGAVALAKAFDD